uniref:TGF-beta family profile domain-containing protein n=1 Tax=Wuchereria bancrofti TaxID=6293 RepID=A0AAF5PJ42_WUCBA
MKHSIDPKSLLLLLSLFICFISCLILKPNEKQIAILQKTVKELLDFEQLPGDVVRSKLRTENAASKYMLRLFNRYKEKNDTQRYSLGNIVRSISPITGTLFDEKLLIFKLNTIKISEQVFQAELHYNIQNMHHFIWKEIRGTIKALGILQNNVKAKTVRLAPTAIFPYWLSFNMTKLVNEALQTNQTIVAVKFLRNGKKIKCAELIKRNTPFLLVYADEPILTDSTKFQSAFNAKAIPDLHIDVTKNPSSRMAKKRSKRMSQYYVYSAKEKQSGNDDNLAERTEQHLKKFGDLGPRILRSRKQVRALQKRKQQKVRSTFRGDPMMGFGMVKKLSKVATVPPLPSIEQKNGNDLTVVLLPREAYSSQSCRAEKLNVRFRDIGWEHWIIAPTSFEAHYCSGICPFPLKKEVNPSNHAIVQSIIHRLGLNPYVPAVCCAPDKMDSLTLLYYDEMDNVVLKNYPRMTVTSCACL